MTNSTYDNIDPKDIKLPVRLPMETWDILEQERIASTQKPK